MSKILKFFLRILRGEDVVLVSQTKERWEHQFADGKWDRLQEGQPNTSELARRIMEYVATKEGRIRILDIGCGNGGLSRLLVGNANFEYLGVDISAIAIDVAQKLAPSGQFVVADAEYPSPDLGMFDVLVFNEVFFYMNPDKVLARYRAHAATGARVFISVVRSWRTPFVFHRVRQHLHIDTNARVSDSSHQWDIVVGHFL
ncbi:MAG: methyltransferase domain-containing protein [Candidatus Paceibacterota bacterium]|jgi:SAM-dependent methyltransferase